MWTQRVWADTGAYAKERQPATDRRDRRQEYDDDGGRTMPREDDRSMRREPLAVDTRRPRCGVCLCCVRALPLPTS